jgi:hypothetical protein
MNVLNVHDELFCGVRYEYAFTEEEDCPKLYPILVQ